MGVTKEVRQVPTGTPRMPVFRWSEVNSSKTSFSLIPVPLGSSTKAHRIKPVGLVYWLFFVGFADQA